MENWAYIAMITMNSGSRLVVLFMLTVPATSVAKVHIQKTIAHCTKCTKNCRLIDPQLAGSNTPAPRTYFVIVGADTLPNP